MRRDPYPIHGPVRSWWRPWRIVRCRCGLEAYPCKVVRDKAWATACEASRLVAGERRIWPSEFAEQRARRGVW